MKHLIQYIKEGLFDVEKNVSDTHELEKNMFEDQESTFWKRCKIVDKQGTPVSTWVWDSLEKEIDINRDVISLPGTSISLDTNIDNPFANKYTLKCDEFYIGDRMGRGPHPAPSDNGGGFKEIHCKRAGIDGMMEKISGYKFILNDKSTISPHFTVYWPCDLDYADIDIEFASNISDSIIRMTYVNDFPNLKNIRSNAKILSLYDSSFFDEPNIKVKLDKFFGTGKIEAKGIVKNKSIRNIVAVINNVRKYGSLKPEYFIPEGKLSDLIDIKGFRAVRRIVMRSNNVRLMFVLPDDKNAIEQYAKYIRLNNMNEFRNTSLNELVDMVKKCQTKDGWVVIFEPEQY